MDSLTELIYVPLDASLAAEAADLAINSRLRGADVVCAAIARRFDAALFTLVKECRRRLPAHISVW